MTDYPPQGFARVITDATLRNFRGFKSAELHNCKLINVIMGRNATGKSTLLEAIFACLGKPGDFISRFHVQRSMAVGGPTTLEADAAFWSDFFFDGDLSKTIEISLEGDANHKRSVQISYDQTKGFMPFNQPPQTAPIPATQPWLVSPATLQYAYNNKTETVYLAPIPTLQNYVPLGTDILAAAAAFFPAAASSLSEAVDRYSRLLATDEHHQLVTELKEQFNFIEEIDVVAPFGVPSLYVKIRGLKTRQQLGLVSGGIAKIVAILLAIASVPGGVVLIDEIENGIFHDRFEVLWRAVYKFALATNTQIFATTHSKECLEGLATASKDWEDQVAFIRSVSDGPNKQFEQFSGNSIFGAMRLGDVR